MRLLSRDSKLLSNFKNRVGEILDILREIIQSTVQKLINISSGISPEQNQTEVGNTQSTSVMITIEVLSILKRIYKNFDVLEFFSTNKVFNAIIDLISVNNIQILKMVLDFLYNFFEKTDGKEKFVAEFGQIFYISKLIFICEKYDETFKISAINLLTKIMDFRIIQDNFRRIRGVGMLVVQLKRPDSSLTYKISILNCMYKLIQRTEIVYDFKVFGIVNLLQQFLQKTTHFMKISLTVNILSLLVFDDDLSLKIMEVCLRDILDILIKCHTSKRQSLKFEDINPDLLLEAIYELQLHCLRLLRFLFSIEKNRKIFKMIFPPKLYATFIDIGNFVKNYNKYKVMADEFNKLTDADIQAIQKTLGTIQTETGFKHNDISHQTIENYTLAELIGKGAFGTVYLAKKGNNKYALKQIPLSTLEMNHKEENKITNENLQEYFKEVKIYKSLKHPNIVTYFESFLYKDTLCIVMELIEGFNLSELIKIQLEKNQSFKESQIWKILIDLCSVLRYLHLEKKIVHRDLNPANIMIDNQFNVKLADFGLAKTLSSSVTMMNSFVGTLIYSCPEIVQNRPYSDKADIWSLGCIAYELVKLKPPFQSNNPLTLAKKIVDKEYEKLDNEKQQYSKELLGFIEDCLTYNEDERPDIAKLLQKISLQLVDQLDKTKTAELQLNEEVIQLTRKMNNLRKDEIFQGKPPLIKIETDSLNKVEDDPIQKSLELIQKISFIANCQTTHKNNFKKFLVDLFYNKMFNSLEITGPKLKQEITRLLTLSKQEITSLNITFDPKDNNKNQKITYEMLQFYIEELFQIFKKENHK